MLWIAPTELKDFRRQVLQHGSQVDGGSFAHVPFVLRLDIVPDARNLSGQWEEVASVVIHES